MCLTSSLSLLGWSPGGDKEKMGEMGDVLVADVSRGELDGEALLMRDYAPTSEDQEGRSRRGSALRSLSAA